MRAIILAGGKGTRLLPYTTVLPKPLMPIGDMPILEVVLRQLKAAGIDRITMAVGHLAELLRAFFNDGARFGMPIDYSVERKPMGTVGPLTLIPDLSATFLIMNGDVLTTLNYADLIAYHRSSGAIATIATHQREVKIDFGVIAAEKSNRLTEYVEKPSYLYQVSMGIYIFEPEVLSYLQPNEYRDFPDLIKTLIADEKKVMSYPFSGYWLDIGRADDYVRATEEFEARRSQFLPVETS
ncbi:MAG: sugar phosphate nucleotidyltransferase [Pseudomonadota bacterium]|nr:sugar phosphate nucleotidyltransferase [Pseudomonadota bacterium]